MKIHRLFCVLMAVFLLLGLSVSVSAASTAEQDIIDACTYRCSADLSEYKITTKEVETLFMDLQSRGELPWYTGTKYTYSYDQDTGYVTKFNPSVYEVDMAAYEEQAAQVLEECIFEGMEQWQIALTIHDFLIAHAAYDETLESNDSYALLVEGSAVCSGYALAYQDLLQRAGIQCRYVDSEAMDHAWNMVCIDGEWYHVDLTWDDPSPNNEGYVSHEYFLLTDEEISTGDKPHHDWNVDIACTDTRFSNSFWRDVNSAILYESKDVCYLLRTQELLSRIYRREEASGKETLLYEEPSNHIDIGYGEYIYEHHGLSLLGGRLWFCSVSKVMSMALDGSDLQTHYTNTGNTYLYGCHVQEGWLYLTQMTHDSVRSDHSVTLEPSGKHLHSFKRTVIEATDMEGGYTLSRCECGLEVKSTPTPSRQWSQDSTKTNTPLLEKHEVESLGNLWIAGVAVVLVGLLVGGIRKGKK